MHDAAPMILRVAFGNSVVEPNAEAGFARIRALTGVDVDDATLSEAVSACVAEGLLHDPVRLPEGALQCHWHLRLTPHGIEAAQAQLEQGGII